jgi:hypothetical protein
MRFGRRENKKEAPASRPENFSSPGPTLFGFGINGLNFRVGDASADAFFDTPTFVQEISESLKVDPPTGN